MRASMRSVCNNSDSWLQGQDLIHSEVLGKQKARSHLSMENLHPYKLYNQHLNDQHHV